jgi:hypothetical protein
MSRKVRIMKEELRKLEPAAARASVMFRHSDVEKGLAGTLAVDFTQLLEDEYFT